MRRPPASDAATRSEEPPVAASEAAAPAPSPRGRAVFARAWSGVRDLVVRFFADDVMAQSAALAFYTALSLPGLALILLEGGAILGRNVQLQLVEKVTGLLGQDAGATLETVTERLAEEDPETGELAGIAGIAMLVVSATGVFAHLQAALNRIWRVAATPGRGLWRWLRKRLLCFGFILALGFVLLVSLAADALLVFLQARLLAHWPALQVLWQALHLVVTALLFTVVFGLILMVLPDARIQWRTVRFGAVVTAFLFMLGQKAIALYLGRATVGSAYGAAGSLLVLLLWTYYASAIVFAGAEIAALRAQAQGGAPPEPHAVKTEGA